jgi:putative FmdB family regulatory protein
VPIYTFYCKKCNKEYDRYFYKPDISQIKCHVCNSKVKKMMTSPGAFKIKGFNASNGYSKKKE